MIGEETFSKRKEHADESKTETGDKDQCCGVSCCMDHRHGYTRKDYIKTPEA